MTDLTDRLHATATYVGAGTAHPGEVKNLLRQAAAEIEHLRHELRTKAYYGRLPVRDLTREEAEELHWERTQAWLKDKNDIKPFTPVEARWQAKQFIANNNEYNLVRLLAEAFLELQDH